MPRLSKAIGDVRLWIKRDDCTGLGFGGNKARQLEFTLGSAVAQGYDTIIQGAGSATSARAPGSASASAANSRRETFARDAMRSSSA